MKIIVLLAFLGILFSLGSALVFLMKDQSKTSRMANALTWRIGLSITLFLFILFAYWMGWIQPTGIR